MDDAILAAVEASDRGSDVDQESGRLVRPINERRSVGGIFTKYVEFS